MLFATPPPLRPLRIRYAAAVVAGVLYGLAMQGLFGRFQLASTISQSFLYGVPFALGFLEVYLAEGHRRTGWLERFTLPAIPLAICLAVALVFSWEGVICVVLLSPLIFLVAAVGGLCAGLVKDVLSKGPRQYVFACCVVVLPLVTAPLEEQLPRELQIRTVRTDIEIHAPAAVIWEQIRSVPLIQPDEQRRGWTQRIGFPKPLAATLDRDGIGGVRRATFQGGVLFVETVDRWEVNHALGFGIRADTASIPSTTLDAHVTIGGPYFDVLDGLYEIEALGGSRAVLHLSSRHRLSTRVNAYAGLWTEAILRDIQRNILLVIRDRCERAR